MKRITINLFGIGELSEDAQLAAFEKYRDYNVQDCIWYDSVLEDFKNICATIGIAIPKKDISFRGFWSQGDGSAFNSSIKAEDFIKGIIVQSWREYAPKLEFEFEPFPCRNWLLALIANGNIDCDMETKIPNRGYWINYNADYIFEPFRSKQYAHIDAELEKLDKWVKRCLERLNAHLYKSLQVEYEYHTSDAALKETFEINNYLFTEDGKMADRLLGLAVDKTEKI